MANKSKTREITIVDNGGTFNLFFKRFSSEKKDYDFEGISALRKLLSNEKARMINVIKNKNPNSLYELAKILKRDLKSVNQDIKLLERFGFVELVSEKQGGRERHKPVIIVDNLYINLKL